MSKTIKELKEEILTHKQVEEQDIASLKEILFDEEGMTKEKADALFEIKDYFGDCGHHPEWEALFIDAVSSFLLEDEESPGTIDDSEGQWLRAKIQHDGRLTCLEKKLLANLKKKSINFPEILHFKNHIVLIFETILFSSRFVTFFAVIGALAASIALFVLSTMQVAKGLSYFFEHFSEIEGKMLEHLVAMFVSSIDGYLFATVLLIFSMGIYELFINKIDLVTKQKDSRPNWLVIHSIDDLKSSLGKVILMILIVSFFEHSLNISYNNIKDLLFLGIGILLIAAALYLTHAHSSKHAEK